MSPLPAPLSSFVGREREVAAVADLLRREDVRLLTLTGPGGVGKTRLALQAVAALPEVFADGIVFISLAPITEPDLVVPTIAQALGLREVGGQPIIERVQVALRQREYLLVLDNFEQIAPVAPVVSSLLSSCPKLKALVTSRTVLHLSGEHEFPVPPLSLPDRHQRLSIDELAQIEAISLFLRRAQAVRPGFALIPANAQLVAEVCTRLDGLPLAIELAAARLKILSPAELLTRLSDRLKLLTGGVRDAPLRLQTMRAAITWSHDLLNGEEQTLFRRLAVFAGGFTLAAAEVVAGDGLWAMGDGEESSPSPDVLDVVAALVDQSLVRQVEQPNGEARFTMLETIRAFALERLDASGEAENLQARQAAWCLWLADQAESAFIGPDELLWLDRLSAELDNIRAALAWAAERGEIETQLRLAGNLWRFWRLRGHMDEAQRWLEDGLAHGAVVAPAVRAKALFTAGLLAYHQGDYERAIPRLQEFLAVSQELHDEDGASLALLLLGVVALALGNIEEAAVRLEEAVSIRRRFREDRWRLAHLGYLCAARYWLGDRAGAVALAEEVLALHQMDENHRSATHGLDAFALETLALVARDDGDYQRAASLYQESLARWQQAGDTWHIAVCLTGLADIATARGRPKLAARLLGAEAMLREALGAQLRPLDRQIHERTLAAARGVLNPEAFAAAWAAGQAITLEQALALVSELTDADPETNDGTIAPHRLTRRELEILRLIAAGHRDHEIAEMLYISHRTVTSHVTNVLNKLGVESRSAAVAYAVRHGLA